MNINLDLAQLWVDMTGTLILIDLAAAVVLAFLARFLWVKLLQPIAQRTKTDLDLKLIEVTKTPVTILTFFGVVYFGLSQALTANPDLTGEAFISAGLKVIYVVMLIVATLGIDMAFRATADWYLTSVAIKTESTLDDEFLPMIRLIGRVVIYFVAATLILGHFGLNISGLVATAGIASLAVALAAQETLSNMFASLTLMMDRPFREGDRIEMDGQLVGDVLEVGMRSTRILSLDNTVIVIPNKDIANSRVINHGFPDEKVKIRIRVGVAYGSSIERVKELLMGAAQGHPDVLEDPGPGAYFTNFGESALGFMLIAWVPSFRTRFRVTDELNTMIYNAFNEAGIEIPFPQRDVHIRTRTKADA